MLPRNIRIKQTTRKHWETPDAREYKHKNTVTQEGWAEVRLTNHILKSVASFHLPPVIIPLWRDTASLVLPQMRQVGRNMAIWRSETIKKL